MTCFVCIMINYYCIMIELLFKIHSFEYNIMLICDIMLVELFCLFGGMLIIYDMLLFYDNLSVVV